MTPRSPPRLGIVTGEQAPDLTDDGRALRTALRTRGFDAEAVRWTDASVAWTDFDALLVRSCWGYHAQLDDFQNWLDRVEDTDVVLLNSAETIRWNLHKSYLRDLEARGVSILPTTWVQRGSDVDLETVLSYNDWGEAVVKPAVGTSSTGVWRTTREDAASHQERFEALLSSGDALVQAFAPEIEAGELSLVFFRGRFSHATRQRPAADDFRAHPSYGGTSAPEEPPRDVVAQAEAVLDAASAELGSSPRDLPYARVDGIERGGEFRLLELELVEPYLSLDASETAVTDFADAIEVHLARHGTIRADT